MFLKRRQESPDANLFRALDPAVVVLDEAGAVVLFSAGAEQLFGIRAAQVQRLGFSQCIACPKEYGLNVAAYLQDYADSTANLWQQPLTAYRYDGRRFALVYRLAPVPDQPGHIVCEFADASDAQALNQHLRQQLEETLASSRAKSRFLHHMTQQFRTPLNRLLGSVSDALDVEFLPRPLQDNLELALLSGRELQRNLNEMVDFTRLESEQLEFQNVTFNFRLVLEEIVDGFADLARRKGIELATLVSPNVPESVMGDPDRLHQILQSLLNNAFRFTHEGGITVKADCQIENPTHAIIELEVTDTGEGMSDDKAQTIRTAFEKRATPFVDRYGGLGIGLAISKELLTLMGGSLTLRSAEGVGTTFKLSLKMAKGIGVMTNHQPLGRHHLLLVTDSLPDRAKLLEYCTEWQLNVENLGSGALALERIRQASLTPSPIEIVLIDLQQHSSAGVQLVQEINKIPAFDNVRILLLVDDRDHANRTANGRLRLDAVLIKPVRKQTLHDAIASVVSRRIEPAMPPITDRAIQEAHHRRAQRALLVEDNEVNQIIAKGALKKLGIHADVTRNGEEAIEAVADKHYDFVLMDCEMPIMDGFEATRAIRAWEQGAGGHLPIIALTANDSSNCHDACMDAGMDEYMQKPFRADQLETILQRVRIKLNLTP